MGAELAVCTVRWPYALDDKPKRPGSQRNNDAREDSPRRPAHRRASVILKASGMRQSTRSACVRAIDQHARRNRPPKHRKTTAPVATIATLGQHEGQSVTLRGWLYNLRESGKLLFPIFRDGTGTVQGVAHVKSVPPEVFEALKGLTQESSVIVTGKVRADKRAPGGFELDVEDIEVIQRVPESDPYPITLKEHGVDFLMEHRHLWVRSPRQSAILRIRAEIMRAAAGVLRQQRLHPHRSADPHTGGLRRHIDAVSRRLLRRSRLSHAVRPALYRVDGPRAGQGLQLRPDVPRGEIENPPPSDRVLDDRARSRLLRSRRPDGTRRKLPLAHRAERPQEPRAGAGSHRPRSWKSSKQSCRPFRACATTKRRRC